MQSGVDFVDCTLVFVPRTPLPDIFTPLQTSSESKWSLVKKKNLNYKHIYNNPNET
jgi:hypothetical protein